MRAELLSSLWLARLHPRPRDEANGRGRDGAMAYAAPRRKPPTFQRFAPDVILPQRRAARWGRQL